MLLRLARQAKRFVLSQFPYPSGSLHMGHCRVYFISDTIARFYRAQGHEVLHPVGWDSFGLPAENEAIRRAIQPRDWTASNIASMKTQLEQLNLAVDWDREFATHQPQYYKFTQQIFLWLFEAGLAYRGQAEVLYDPVDKTVLAKQQVDAEGRAWRTGALAQKKSLQQWFFRTTRFAKELSENEMPWPQKVKQMQRGWIDYREGLLIRLQTDCGQSISFFVEHVQFIFGTAAILLPSDSTVRGSFTLLKGKQIPLLRFQLHKQCISEATALIPESGEKEFILAKELGLVWQKVKVRKYPKNQFVQNSEEFSGLERSQARSKMALAFGGLPACRMRLEDWLISRQRGWGTPIPIIRCKDCGDVPVREQDLPVLLPHSINYQGVNTKQIGSPLLKDQSFLRCKCPKCGCPAERQTDTMDTFVDSSWYFMRFLNPKASVLLDKQQTEWLPVDYYVGGMQHAIMHLLYARFIFRAVGQKLGLAITQPFKRLITQGYVMSKSYREENGRYIPPEDAEGRSDLKVEVEKMSKSKLNGVAPQTVLLKYGSDALRLGLLFVAPSESNINFESQFIERMHLFLKKVERELARVFILGENRQQIDSDTGEITRQKLKTLLQSYLIAMESTQKPLHTAAAKLFQTFNLLDDKQPESELLVGVVLFLMVSPFAPGLCDRLTPIYSKLKGLKSLKMEEGFPVIQSQFIQVKVFKNNKFIDRRLLRNQKEDQTLLLSLGLKVEHDSVIIKRQSKSITVNFLKK